MNIIVTGFDAIQMERVQRGLQDYHCNTQVMRGDSIVAQLRSGLNVFQTAEAIVNCPGFGTEEEARGGSNIHA